MFSLELEDDELEPEEFDVEPPEELILLSFPVVDVVLLEEVCLVPCDCDMGAHEQHAIDAINRREEKFLNMGEYLVQQFIKIMPSRILFLVWI